MEDNNNMNDTLTTFRREKLLAPTKEEYLRTHHKRALLRWYERCNELKFYWKKHGNCNVPWNDPKMGQVSDILTGERLIYIYIYIYIYIHHL